MRAATPQVRRTISRAVWQIEDTRAEIAEVAGAYRSARILDPEQATVRSFVDAVGGADVIHIAGHTERGGSDGELAFVFAGGERVSPERVDPEVVSGGQPPAAISCSASPLEAFFHRRRTLNS